MNKNLHSKFGTATLNREGYYRITSTKEGNRGKYLHRLIWQSFYDCDVPKGYHIHHKNGNKTDNCILNLQLVSKSEHHSIHAVGENNSMYGKPHSLSHQMEISKSTNTSGYFRVTREKCPKCKQGFTNRYEYYDENGKPKHISSVNIHVLEKKVRDRGLPWKKFDNKEVKE